MENEKKEWRFSVVGNIVKQHMDEEGVLRYGTKAFTGGTKVYLAGKDWDTTWDYIGVIGLNRFGRYTVEGVPLALIENVRVQRVYKPKVMDMMDYLEATDGWAWWRRTAEDHREAIALCELLSKR